MAEELKIDEFRQRIDATKIRCELCSYRDHSLVQHLKGRHNLTPGQYKNQFPNAALASKIVGELLRRIPRAQQRTNDLTNHLTSFEFDDHLEQSLVKLSKELEKIYGQVAPELKGLVPEADPNFRFTERVKAIGFAAKFSKNIFISGPTGCGKTQEIIQAFAHMKRPLKRCNMQGDVTAANFIGQLEADPAKGTYFSYGILPIAMKQGIPLLVDEFDFTPPHIAAVLHPAMEGVKTLFIPETKETIVAKPGFFIAATGNTGGKGDQHGVYTGTEILNTALLDRFPLKLQAAYLSEKEEKEMLGKRFPNESGPEVEKMVKGANEVRTAFMQGKLALTISTRKLVDYFEFKSNLGADYALQVTVLNWLEEDDRELVRQLLEHCGISVPRT